MCSGGNDARRGVRQCACVFFTSTTREGHRHDQTLSRRCRRSALGVVADADLDIAARWQSLKDVFEQPEFGYVLPQTPQYGGTIVEHFDIENTIFPQKIGLWLMPDNKMTGMLEDFLKMIVQNNDVLMLFAKESVGNVQSNVAETIRFYLN